MPGSVVASLYVPFFDISIAGNVLVLPCSEGTVGTDQVNLNSGAWSSASLSLKKSSSINGARPQAFSTPVTITADHYLDNSDTTGVSAMVLTVDTASGTAGSTVSVRMTCKGDRITGKAFVDPFSQFLPGTEPESPPFGGGGTG